MSAAWRALCVALLVLSAKAQRAFDTSGDLVGWTLRAPPGDAWTRWARHLVRWDTVYFVGMADPARGYVYEQMLAFQPGIVGVLRLLGYDAQGAWDPARAVLRASALVQVLSVAAPVLLYRYAR